MLNADRIIRRSVGGDSAIRKLLQTQTSHKHCQYFFKTLPVLNHYQPPSLYLHIDLTRNIANSSTIYNTSSSSPSISSSVDEESDNESEISFQSQQPYSRYQSNLRFDESVEEFTPRTPVAVPSAPLFPGVSMAPSVPNVPSGPMYPQNRFRPVVNPAINHWGPNGRMEWRNGDLLHSINSGPIHPNNGANGAREILVNGVLRPVSNSARAPVMVGSTRVVPIENPDFQLPIAAPVNIQTNRPPTNFTNNWDNPQSGFSSTPSLSSQPSSSHGSAGMTPQQQALLMQQLTGATLAGRPGTAGSIGYNSFNGYVPSTRTVSENNYQHHRRFRPGATKHCFNCGNPSHFVRECPMPPNRGFKAPQVHQAPRPPVHPVTPLANLHQPNQNIPVAKAPEPGKWGKEGRPTIRKTYGIANQLELVDEILGKYGKVGVLPCVSGPSGVGCWSATMITLWPTLSHPSILSFLPPYYS